MANDWGDVELDAKGMRALAHPVRLAILERLREQGPDTATGLAPHVGASPSVTSWHLRHLAEHGLVEDAPSDGRGRKRWWQAVGRGIRFAGDTDPAAYRQLTEAIEVVEGDLVQSWRARGAAEPRGRMGGRRRKVEHQDHRHDRGAGRRSSRPSRPS